MFGEVSAEDAGRMTGQAVVWLALLAGAWKCFSISRRPTTNAKCALALMFVLLAMFIAGCLGYLIRISERSPGIILVSGLTGLLTLGLLVTALVLGILGLVEFSKQPGTFNQGRSQAVWTLVLVALFGTVALTGFIKGLVRRSSSEPVEIPSKPGETLTFDELNFRFRPPGHPWAAIKPGILNKESKVSLLRRSPQCYFIVIAENLGRSSISTSEELAEIAKAHMQSVASSSRIISETAQGVNGLTGVLVKQHAVVESQNIYYEQWFFVTNGFGYQLMGWGNFKDQKRVTEELAQMFPRFELIDPMRIGSASGKAFVTNFISPRYFYAVDVTNSVWHAFTSLKTNFPRAEFGASRGDSCFAILPVWLCQQECEPDALTSALLNTMNIEYPDEALTNRVPIAEGDFRGEQFDFTREVDRTAFQYRFRILQGKGCAYLIAAWTQRRGTDVDAVLQDALGRVTFPPTGMAAFGTNAAFADQETKNQGYVLNQAGLYFFRAEDYEKALPLLRAAVSVDKTNLDYLQNLLLTWSRSARSQEGLAFLETVAPELLAKPEILAFRAYFQSKCSLVDQALTNYAKAFVLGYRDESDLRDFVNLLLDQYQYERAHAAVDSYLKIGDSLDVRLLRADICREEKNFQRGIDLLKVEHQKAPYNAKITKTLAEFCLEADRTSEALDYSRELIKSNGKSGSAYYLKARCELKLKWYREAKASLEIASKLSPANVDMRSDLAYVSGLLGEGNNSALKEPIAPVQLPAAITNTPATPAPGDFAKDYGAYYSRWITAVSFVPQREYKSTDYMWVQLKDAAGVEAFSTIQASYDPLSEDIFVNEVRVMDAAGQTLSVGKVGDCYVIDDPSDGTANHDKTVNIPVAGLYPGCRLFVAVTRRSAGRSQAFPFLDHRFSRWYPVLESSVFLQGQTNGLAIRTSAPVVTESLPEGCWWHISSTLAARWEPQQPPVSTFMPMLWISDKADTWTTIASNYLASIGDRLQFDENFRSLVQRLVTGLPDDQSKIGALSRYVQTNCTYKAIEFGRRARIPNKPAEILSNRYGDCKDHAVLLQQMLAASGLAAQLTLVSRHGELLNELPTLDQFDHMIVYVPGKSDGRFVDCTDKGADLSGTVPPGLADYEVFILDPKNPRIARIPSYPGNASTIELEQQIRLTNATDLTVEARMSLTGVHAAFLRNFLRSYSTADQQLAMQRAMGLRDVEFSDFKVESLEDPSAPLRLRYACSLKKQFRHANDRLLGTVGASFGRYYLAAEPVNKRLTPFEIKVPLTLRSAISIAVPDGFRAEETPPAIPQIDSRFAACRAYQRLDGSKLLLNFDFRQEKGSFDASDYSAYRETMKHALATLEGEISFKAISK
ncbi:MAG: DUF3857 domain-containing protein [Verrucomicrobiota bacterium]